MFRLILTLFSLAITFTSASITCLKVGSTATARWVDGSGKSCTWTGVVGSNFGVNSINGGMYDCNGRCGAGCAGMAVGNVYAQDCFSHDICSYFYNAAGGASDPNCGAAFKAAEDDTALGLFRGCSATNPSVVAQAPTVSPVCV